MRRVVLLILLIACLPSATAYAQDNTFVTDDGRYALRYPAEWTLTDVAGYIQIESRSDALNLNVEDLTSDDLAGYLITPDGLTSANASITPDQTPAEASILVLGEGVPVEDANFAPQRTGLQAIVTDEGFTNLEYFALFFQLPDGNLVILIASALDVDPFIETLYHIAASFHRLSERGAVSLQTVTTAELPTLDQTFTSFNNALTVRYPAGWQAGDTGFITILSPSGVTSGTVPSGELSVYIAAPQTLDYDLFFSFGSTARHVALQWSTILRLVFYDIEATNVSNLELLTLAEHDMYFISFNSGIGDIAVLTFEVRDDVVLVYGVAAPNEMDSMISTILAIAASVQQP